MPIDKIIYISHDDKRMAVVWPITRSCVRFERDCPRVQQFELLDELTFPKTYGARRAAQQWTKPLPRKRVS